MLRKKETLTIITPIPGFIPRQLAIDILHSHAEIITLNPLVLDHKPIAAPQNAETDEYYSTWYEITERITFMPGIGKMGASIIKFNGCFHDMPWGLQTHIYAPMNVDLRNKYRIAGNQPGVEPPEPAEIGLKAMGVPSDGLYLREDIEVKCNVTVMSFVKAQLKKAGGEMVQRIIKKAELLDAGVLQAMMEDGKLKTINPADRRNTVRRSPLPSPSGIYQSGTPPPQTQSPQIPYQIPRPGSQANSYRPGTASSQQGGSYNQPPTPGYGPPGGAMELPAAEPNPGPGQQFAVEMPGDFYHPTSHLQPQQSPRPSQGQFANNNYHRDSKTIGQGTPDSSSSQGGQWTSSYNSTSGGSRPSSLSSNNSGGLQSPGLESKFSSGLSPHRETTEEHRDDALRKLDPRIPHPSHYPPYNPADYAKQAQLQQQRLQYGHQGQPRYNYTQ
ncbi:hypothetical protein QBC37DRAFT_169389 [Rhypophila decipiens]|uniref:DUF7053 domain-containing protein n=1 Tax=Rhypophila decipiens TaxID=261697 RepID=A0AAN6YCS7_9PEZI|nr:hypothetical protein QBC37DRAFT_169389 [Rhypophila decipiens]